MTPCFSIAIVGRLPGLNEVTAQNRRNRYAGAKQKRTTEQAIIAQLGGVPVKVPRGCRWRFTWYENDKRRDPDNVASAVKFIFDAFKVAGIIPNDNWDYVAAGIEHRFLVQSPTSVLVEAFNSQQKGEQ